MSYGELLRDPRWQRKRLEIFDRDDFACQNCGSESRELHCHHRSYERGREPWDYPNQNFVTLCFICHQGEHVPDEPEDTRPAWEKNRTLHFLARILAVGAFEFERPDWLVKIEGAEILNQLDTVTIGELPNVDHFNLAKECLAALERQYLKDKIGALRSKLRSSKTGEIAEIASEIQTITATLAG